MIFWGYPQESFDSAYFRISSKCIRSRSHTLRVSRRGCRCTVPQRQITAAARLTEKCHHLKHDPGAATQLYEQMLQVSMVQPHSKLIQENLDAAVTYFRNHRHQMNYAAYREQHYPIGSGVTEAACKTVIKQRLCCSGMRWKQTGAAVLLSLRTLVLTPTRWNQFWHKLNQYGFPVAL